jgi:hypothetical protein
MDPRLRPGALVRVRKPSWDEPDAAKWMPELDSFDGQIFRVRSIEESPLPGCNITLEGATNLVCHWYFHEDWLTLVAEAEFAGFCDACSGFRRHRLGCPIARAED